MLVRSQALQRRSMLVQHPVFGRLRGKDYGQSLTRLDARRSSRVAFGRPEEIRGVGQDPHSHERPRRQGAELLPAGRLQAGSGCRHLVQVLCLGLTDCRSPSQLRGAVQFGPDGL